MGIETKLCDVSQEVDTIVYLTIAKGSAALWKQICDGLKWCEVIMQAQIDLTLWKDTT